MSKVKTPIGMLTSTFHPITAEPAASHPTYGTAKDMGAAVKGYLSVTTAEAEIAGDDIIQLSAESFVSGQVDVETTLSDLEINATLFGHTYSEQDGEVSAANDAPVPGAYSFIEPILKADKSRVYRATVLFKCTAIMGSEKQEADTRKPSELNPKMNAVSFKVTPDASGAWRQRKDLTTEAAATTWINNLLHPTQST